MVGNNQHTPQDEVGDGTRRRPLLKTLGVGLSASALGSSAVAGSPDQNRTPPFQDDETSSPLPGPSVLYDDPATPPQLETSGIWSADPLLVSGASAYDDGEFLYQDFVYDDHGANTTDVPEAPPHPQTDVYTYSPPTGDVVYPTDADTYGYNAADLLEFRVQPTGESLTYRITLQTMKAPDVAGVAIGINTDGDTATGQDDWGYGIGSLGPLGLDHRIVTWGTGAELDGSSADADASVDLERNQIEVEVPLSPGEETWRHYVVVGLFDPDAGQFKQIQLQPSQTEPGGSHGASPPPIFNVGFRRPEQEPLGGPHVRRDRVEEEIQDAQNQVGSRTHAGYGHWREHRQAKALEGRDISEFHADIDFGKLRDGVTDRSVPETGYLSRVYGSRYDLGEGIHNGTSGSTDTSGGNDIFLNAVQPYVLYVPDSYDPDGEHPLHLFMHGYTSSYNELGAFEENALRQLGEQRDALILSVEARGPGLSYGGVGELDTFEALSDVLSRYSVDLDRITISGYSMGGYGTFKLASQWPDLFAKAFPIVGAADDSVTPLLENLRHVPVLMWNASNDELVPANEYVPTQQELEDLGYRHELDIFLGYDHFGFGYRDQWGKARDFLEGEFLGDLDAPDAPAHVTYRADPSFDQAEYDLIHDGAYWVSDIEVASGADTGSVDVRSLYPGDSTPKEVPIRGADTEPDPHTKQGIRWQERLFDPASENTLEVTLDSVGSATFWVDEAPLDEDAPITLVVESTDSATLILTTGGRSMTVDVPPGESTHTVRL